MTEFIREWLLGVSSSAIILAVLDTLTVNSGVKRICRMAGGLVLILAAVTPIVKLDHADLLELTEQHLVSTERSNESLQATNDFLYESIIAEDTAAYILDKAESLGVSCHVEVGIVWENELPIPSTVTIVGNLSEEQRAAIGALLEADLGIQTSQQHFEVRRNED